MTSTEKLATEIAQRMKIARLSRMPGMDKVAVALNCKPTYGEMEAVEAVLKHAKELGYTIEKKP